MPNEALTSGLAILGAVTGTLGFVVSVLTYRRDASRLRVELIRGIRVSNGPADDAARRLLALHRERNEDPPMALFLRDPDKTWALLKVTNAGRRTIYIEKIGWIGVDGKFTIPAGYMGDPEWLPATIEEGTSKDYLVEDSHVEHALAAFAIDRTGRIHFGTFARSWPGFVLAVKARLHVSPYA